LRVLIHLVRRSAGTKRTCSRLPPISDVRERSVSVIRRSAAAIVSIAVITQLVVGSASGAREAASPTVDMEVRLAADPAQVVARGGALRVELTVTNAGRSTAPSVPTRVFLSRDRRPSRGDIALDPPLRLGAVAPGAMRRRTTVVRIPKHAPLGRWRIIGCAERDALPASNPSGRQGCGGSEGGVRVVNAPSLEAVDGGSDYYGRFANTSGMDSPSYFPIAVWGAYEQTKANRDRDAAAGINTYVWAADNSFLTEIRADGRFKVIQAEDQRSGVGTETSGWVLADEIDMQQSNSTGAAAARSQLHSTLAGLPADGRIRYANYGKGVIFWNSGSDAERYVNDFTQLVSTDVYWFTESDVCVQSQGGELFGLARSLTAAECHRASNYGAQVARVRALDAMDGTRQPVWNFVETGHPFDNDMNGNRSIAPAEMRAAVWHSIIAGARGILYFQHSAGGGCAGDHHTIRTNCEGTRPMVTSVNARIKSLAPALNGASVVSGWSRSPTTRAMLKAYRSDLYLFAGSADNVNASGSFSIPCAGDARATVIGENRTIPVRGGSFTDRFRDGNAIHIYRIPRAPSCGLA
jgi:hypothetical protein